jgi:hypothetical protein
LQGGSFFLVHPFVQELLTDNGLGFVGTLPYWWCFYLTISATND